MCSNTDTNRRDLEISTVRMKSEGIVDVARAVECICRKPTLDYDTRTSTSSRLAVNFGSRHQVSIAGNFVVT